MTTPVDPTGTLPYIWLAAQHFRHGRPGKPQSIILHATEGHKDSDLQTLVTGDGRNVSVHWYVLRDGTIYHMVQDGDIANHAGAVMQTKYSNSFSLGIEQEHIAGEDDWPDIQVQTTARICAFLQQQYGPIEITSHAHAAAPSGRKTDPEGYPWTTFYAALETAKQTTWSASQVQS